MVHEKVHRGTFAGERLAGLHVPCQSDGSGCGFHLVTCLAWGHPAASRIVAAGGWKVVVWGAAAAVAAAAAVERAAGVACPAAASPPYEPAVAGGTAAAPACASAAAYGAVDVAARARIPVSRAFAELLLQLLCHCCWVVGLKMLIVRMAVVRRTPQQTVGGLADCCVPCCCKEFGGTVDEGRKPAAALGCIC